MRHFSQRTNILSFRPAPSFADLLESYAKMILLFYYLEVFPTVE